MTPGRPDVGRLVAQGRGQVGTEGEAAWFDRLDEVKTELDEWMGALLDRPRDERAVQAAADLWPYWSRRAPDGPDWLRRAYVATLEAPPSEALAELRYGAGLAAFRAGDNDTCIEMSEAALRTADAVGSDRERARARIGLCRAAFRRGAYEEGHALADQADRDATAAGSEELRTTALHMRAELTRARGDYAACAPMYRQLLAIDLARGDTRSLAMEHYNLGSALVQTGDLVAAREHLGESLRLSRRDQPDQLPYTLLGVAGLLARDGDAELAALLLGAVMEHFERVGEVLDPAEALELDTHLAVLAARIEDSDVRIERGRRLGLADALNQVPDLD